MVALITSSHQIDRFQHLESSDLTRDNRSIKLLRLFGAIGADAADEVRLGVHQRPQQIVQARVEVLSQCRDRIVPVQSKQQQNSSVKKYILISINKCNYFMRHLNDCD